MILDLLKFGLVFFFPTLIGRAYKLFNESRNMSFSIISWKTQKNSHKLVQAIVLTFVIYKLASVFVFGSENFFSKINARIDSQSYIIRNHYRSYLEFLADRDIYFKEIVTASQNGLDLSKFQETNEFKEFLTMQTLSEQLKIKEKRNFYSKFGEYSFLNCNYCANDIDFIMFLAPSIVFQYALFLFIIGILSSNSQKCNWRNYGLVLAAVIFACEAYAFFSPTEHCTKFELYDAIFNDDQFTLRYEKIEFLREITLIMFMLIALFFDNGQDLRFKSLLDQLRTSSELSLAFLQAARIQEAALAIDENLCKFSKQSKKNNPSKLAAIISEPSFRQKVAESGHKLNFEELMQQKSNSLEELLKISK